VLGWRDSQLLNADLSTTQAYTVFQFARSELRNAAYSGMTNATDIGSSSNHVKGYKFLRGDNHRVWVLWSKDGNAHTITLSTAPLGAWDVLGNSVSPSSSMSVTVKPLYLEWNP